MTELRATELIQALHDRSVRFLVIGGFAVMAHGVIRATKDLDILPAPDAENLERLAELLKAIRARVDIGDMDPSEAPLLDARALIDGQGNWVLTTSLGRLDIMQRVSGARPYPALLADSIDVSIPGVTTSTKIIGLHDLIRMKAAAGRPQDLADIADVEAARTVEDEST